MNFQSKLGIGLLLISVPAASLVLGASPSSSPQAQTRVAAAATEAPNGKMSMLITDEVRHQLLMLSNYGIFDWLEYEANPDRTATLRGQVTRPSLKSDAENALRKIEGMPRIDNQIEVLPISPSDDQIRIAVYRAILRYEGPLFRYATQSTPPIHIIVNNGRVTLKGVVDSEGDSQLAQTAAKGISGIFDVKNELRVTKRS